jgi:hypothetical protein
VADESRIGTRYMDGRRASPRTGPKLLRVRAIPAVGLSSAAPSIDANGGDGDHERQRVTEDRFEMNDELGEPMRTSRRPVKLMLESSCPTKASD